jgi:general secretion pathway protein G
MAGALKFPRDARAGFTLIELIGVMAIVAILAAVAVPATVRTLERAAVDAERTTLRRLGEHTKLHLRRTGALPTAATWTTDLAAYSELPASGLGASSRQMARSFLVEPLSGGNPSSRVLILSSMRQGLAVAATATAPAFAEIWNTPDGERPASWTGWPAHHGEFLVIERVNLTVELQTYTLRLQNAGGSAVSYAIVRPGAATVVQTLPSGFLDVPMRTGWRLDLFRDSAGALLGYSYVVSDRARSFHFDGTVWTAP